ncbi:MAG: imidazole glycerol phosphate synthase subunit HisH [Thermomicrobiales bacterium]|nr:imidazole glycerol phosphate synthase subunit HisH [Thermomicrobiales bacterium]
MIAIIDYGSGNLRSIQRGLESHGVETTITPDPVAMIAADAVVLPGVGNASHAMDRLRASGIAGAIYEVTEAGKPFLGICVGMQVLFEAQEEGNAMGLGLLRGEVVKLTEAEKVPHIGWNISRPLRQPLLSASPADPYFYFVHSYVARPADPQDVIAEATYGQTFPSAVMRDNIWGTQFHPERSGDNGLAFLGQWVEVVRAWQRRKAA